MTVAVTDEVLDQASKAAARPGLSTDEFCLEAIARAAGQVLHRRTSTEAANAFWDSVSPEEKNSLLRVLGAGLADLPPERW